MSFGAGRLEGLGVVASEDISLSYASLCHEKGYHQCPRTVSLCLQDLDRLGLLDTWPQHLRTNYQQNLSEI